MQATTHQDRSRASRVEAVAVVNSTLEKQDGCTAKDAETQSLQKEARNSQYSTPLNNNADTSG